MQILEHRLGGRGPPWNANYDKLIVLQMYKYNFTGEDGGKRDLNNYGDEWKL